MFLKFWCGSLLYWDSYLLFLQRVVVGFWIIFRQRLYLQFQINPSVSLFSKQKIVTKNNNQRQIDSKQTLYICSLYAAFMCCVTTVLSSGLLWVWDKCAHKCGEYSGAVYRVMVQRTFGECCLVLYDDAMMMIIVDSVVVLLCLPWCCCCCCCSWRPQVYQFAGHTTDYIHFYLSPVEGTVCLVSVVLMETLLSVFYVYTPHLPLYFIHLCKMVSCSLYVFCDVSVVLKCNLLSATRRRWDDINARLP